LAGTTRKRSFLEKGSKRRSFLDSRHFHEKKEKRVFVMGYSQKEQLQNNESGGNFEI